MENHDDLLKELRNELDRTTATYNAAAEASVAADAAAHAADVAADAACAAYDLAWKALADLEKSIKGE